MWQQCPVTLTTDLQALREQIFIKDYRKSAYSNDSSCISVILYLQKQKICERGVKEQKLI